MYKIQIEEITEKEYPETNRVYQHKDADGAWNECPKSARYGCDTDVVCKNEEIPTGKMLKRTDTEKVFEQTVDELDLQAVIKAVNGM